MRRREAFLEAALLCSQYADNLAEDRPEWRDVALECARMLEEEADEDTRSYPPGARVSESDH